MDVPEVRGSLGESRSAVSAAWIDPPYPVAWLIVVHGAGAGMDHPFIVGFCRAMAEHGVATTRFNFSYIKAGLGTLNISQGTTVMLTAGVHGYGGDLNVSCSGMTVSRWIDVLQERFAPTFTAPLPDQTRTEDSGEWALDISEYVSDLEDPDLDAELVLGECIHSRAYWTEPDG